MPKPEDTSGVRLTAFAAAFRTGKVVQVGQTFTVFQALANRDEFETAAKQLSSQFQFSYGYVPATEKKVLGREYWYVVILEDTGAEPVDWPNWVMKWL